MAPSSSKKQKVANRDSELLCNWLRYETSLLNRLILRNRDQHRGTIFMRWVLSSLRFLRRFNSRFLAGKKTPELRNLVDSEDFSYSYFTSLNSVTNSLLHLSRVHVHRYFVPFCSTLIAIFSRIFLILIRIPKSVRLGL